MNRSVPTLRPAIQIPGLAAHPDLERRLRAEETRLAGCSGCQRTALVRKYQAELRRRQRGARA